MGKLITGWWEELGLDIQYSVEDNGMLIDGGYNYAGDTYKPDYDIYIWAWQPSGSDPGRRLGYFRTVQIENQNDACWSNKEYDDLWEQQSEELDQQKRKEIAYQMQEILYEESPYIILDVSQAPRGVEHGQVGGLAAHPAAQRRRRLHQRQRQQLLQGGAQGGGDDAESSSGSSMTWIIVVVVAVVVVVAIVLIVLRRKPKAEEG